MNLEAQWDGWMRYELAFTSLLVRQMNGNEMIPSSTDLSLGQDS